MSVRNTIDEKIMIDEIACASFVVLSDKDSGEI